MNKISYAGYRFPPAIIHRAIWLYLRFTLSLRDVEDLLSERGITVSYETVRRWVNHFGPMIAADLRKRRPKPHTTWHLVEVYLKIDGRMVYPWRAVDAEGEVLGVLVQAKRDRHTALKLMSKLLKKDGFVPELLITDDLRSYRAAARDLGMLALPAVVKHRSLTSFREKLVKIGAKIVTHARYATFQMAEVAVPRGLFAEVLRLIAQLRAPPAPA